MSKEIKEMSNTMVKFENGKLVITVPISKVLDEGLAELSSSGKSYLVATSHGSQPVVKVPGLSFSVNVTMKKESYEQTQRARQLLNQPTKQEDGLATAMTKLSPEKRAIVEAFMAALA